MVLRIVVAVVLVAFAGFVWWVREQANTEVPVIQGSLDPTFEKKGVVGVKPDVGPAFDVSVELRQDRLRNELHFTITERHGWYADHLRVEFRYEEPDDSGQWRQVGEPLLYQCRSYLDFGATLVEHTMPVETEFPELDDFGSSENWKAQVVSWYRVLAPEPP